MGKLCNNLALFCQYKQSQCLPILTSSQPLKELLMMGAHCSLQLPTWKRHRGRDSSQRCTWQSKEWVTQAMMCEICKAAAKTPLIMGLNARYKKEIRNEHILLLVSYVENGPQRWEHSSSVNINYLAFLPLMTMLGKPCQCISNWIVLNVAKRVVLKATHRHPSCSVSAKCIACW